MVHVVIEKFVCAGFHGATILEPCGPYVFYDYDGQVTRQLIDRPYHGLPGGGVDVEIPDDLAYDLFPEATRPLKSDYLYSRPF